MTEKPSVRRVSRQLGRRGVREPRVESALGRHIPDHASIRLACPICAVVSDYPVGVDIEGVEDVEVTVRCRPCNTIWTYVRSSVGVRDEP